MITRAEYMADSKLHHAYYLEVAREAGISYAKSEMLAMIKAALSAGDEHLNTISLGWWDHRARGTVGALERALRVRGEAYSLGCGVCAHKAAAKADAEPLWFA